MVTPASGAITRCWPWLLSTGDVLMARLREGRANTALTVRRWGGCATPGPHDNSPSTRFYTHLVTAARQREHHHPPGDRWATPEDAWTPIPYWMEGAAGVAETAYTPFGSKPYAAPVRLIVRRVKPAPGSQLALFASYSYHGFITDRDGAPWIWRPTIAATPRSKTPSVLNRTLRSGWPSR